VLTSATWLCSGSGASTACGNHERKNISASKISRTAKRSGPYSSRAAPIPRILPTSPTTGRRRSSFAYPSSNTPRAKCAAGYGSGLSPKNAAPLLARSSPRASSSFWSVAASRSAICSGRPTTAGNAKATSQKLSATASTCASRLPHNTYQSDVETVHRLEEDEFFVLEEFRTCGEFLAKVPTGEIELTDEVTRTEGGKGFPEFDQLRFGSRRSFEGLLMANVRKFEQARRTVFEQVCGAFDAALFDALDQSQTMAVSVHFTHQIEIPGGSNHGAAILLAAGRPALPPAGRPSPTAFSRSNTSTSPRGYDVTGLFHARILLASARLPGLLPQRLRGLRCP